MLVGVASQGATGHIYPLLGFADTLLARKAVDRPRGWAFVAVDAGSAAVLITRTAQVKTPSQP
jgi:hypothetical protein